MALGVFMVRSGESKGWPGIVLFGLCMLVFAVQLHPGSSWLEIHADRIELCTLFRRSQILFAHVRGFSVNRIGPNTVVTIEFRPEAPSATGRAVAIAITGAEGALPDTYGLNANDLSERLNGALMRWRATGTESSTG